MKKNECNCTSNSPHHCRTCSGGNDYRSEAVDANLYAAEFLLYAFHFDNELENVRQTMTATSTLRMLVSEG